MMIEIKMTLRSRAIEIKKKELQNAFIAKGQQSIRPIRQSAH